MSENKLFTLLDSVTPQNFEQAMDQAIALELATVPTYLSTYYSIDRAQDQDTLYQKIYNQLKVALKNSEIDIAVLAEELKKDVLVYANQSAALIMSVVVEEMLHLALASNVRQAIVGPPELMKVAASPGFKFPTYLDGHEPEFWINLDTLNLKQLGIFLQIESPKPFTDSADFPETDEKPIKYKTIGELYNMIIQCVQTNYPGPYPKKPQLLPPTPGSPQRPYYSQNSINTVYYDRDHNPKFGSEDSSGALVDVYDAGSATQAMEEIRHQGEGNDGDKDLLKFDSQNNPVPLPVVDGKVQGLSGSGNYDSHSTDGSDEELSHFAKFMELYSLGIYYQNKFKGINGLDDFFSYFVANQQPNPKQATYDAGTSANDQEIALMNKLGNAIYTYIILMVETCYYKDESTQFQVFMYGIHKSMIWLLSDIGNAMRSYTFNASDPAKAFTPSLSFEFYDFSILGDSKKIRPKDQIINLAKDLAASNGSSSKSNWSWLYEDKAYLPSLPDVGLDHSVTANVPSIPA